MTKKGYKQTEKHKKHSKENRASTSGKNNGRWVERIEWSCPVCGTIKMLTPCAAAKRQFCSKKCASKGKNNGMYGKFGKDSPNWVEKVLFTCQYCGATEYITPNALKRKRYCSPECKRLAGQSKEMIEKISGENNVTWKGDNVGYRGIHHWIIKIKGPAKNYKCIDCGKQARDWSNVDHSYKRILEDYQPRCVSCHRKYDFQMKRNNKIKTIINLLKFITKNKEI